MIFLITNLEIVPYNTLLLKIRSASLNGADAILLRENNLNDDDYERLLIAALEMTTNTKTEIIVCHRPEIARRFNLKLHSRFSERLDESYSISTHSEEEILVIKDHQYCFYSHVFSTDCKKGLPPRTSLPLKSHTNSIALGGVTLKTLPKLEGICQHIGVMSEWLLTPSIGDLIHKYRSFGY